MAYMALYRKYRPLSFEEVVEQDYIVKTLKNAIMQNMVAHAYLFCGSRGTGKTSFAKIFARAVNCTNPQEGNPCNQCNICKGILSGQNMDVMEMDAASNNGVDNVREIREEVLYTPSISKYKVYIIDEVHMLSSGAFNALLKTLEEPPSHVIFILATTEAHKIPTTILSRCQRFDFRRISTEGIAKQLQWIAKDHGVNLKDDGAKLIGKLAEGGLRDGISILDQCMMSKQETLDAKTIFKMTGMAGNDFVGDVAKDILAQDVALLFQKVEDLYRSGKDLRHFVSELTHYFRDLLVLKWTKDVEVLFSFLEDDIKEVQKLADGLDENLLIAMIKDLSLLDHVFKGAIHPRVSLEVALVKLCQRKFSDAVERLEQLEYLENRVDKLERLLAESGRSGKEAIVRPSQPKETEKQNMPTLPSQKSQERNQNMGSLGPIPEPHHMKDKPDEEKRAPMGKPVSFWQDVLEEIKSMGRMALYGNLMDSSAFYESDKLISIELAISFNKMTVSKVENKEIIENILKQKLGREVCVQIREPAETSSGRQPKESSSLDKTLEIVKKVNIPFNIIDD
jgi:DNA polymerase III subunit gamma/tau